MNNKTKKGKLLFTLIASMLLVLFLFGGIYYVKSNLESIVNYALNKSLDYNLEINEIKINNWGTIIGKKVLLRDKEGKKVLEIPEVQISYEIRDIIQGRYITEIWVKNPEVFLEIKEVSKINIMDALNLNKPKKESNAPSPIRGIKITNGRLHLKDYSYKKLIDLEVENLKGFIDLNKLFALEFFGNSLGDLSQELMFGIKEIKKNKYDYKIQLKNVELKDELLQYAYDDNESITYKSGRADLDLSFGDSGLKGTAFIRDGVINYQYLVDDLKKVKATIDFDNEKLDIFANSKLDKYSVNFELNKKNRYLGIFFNTKEIDISYILKNLPSNSFYKDIKGSVDKLKGQLVFQDIEKSRPNLELFAESKEINYLEHNLTKIDLSLDFDFNNFKFIINNLDMEYKNILSKDYFVNVKSKLKGVYEEDKLKLDYDLSNINSFFSNNKFNGNFTYDFKSENLELKNENLEYPFEFGYNLKNSDISLNGVFVEPINFYTDTTKNTSIEGSINLAYNLNEKRLEKALGKVTIHNDSYFKNLYLDFENYGEELFFNDIYGVRNNSMLKAKGVLNSNSLEYTGEVTSAYINSKDFPYLKDGPEFNLNTSFTINGKGKDFDIDYNANISDFGYGVNLKNTNFYGHIQNKDNNIKGTAEGYVKNMIYNDLSFKDLYLNLSFDNSRVYIDKIMNANLFLSGTYDIPSNSLDFSYKLNDYDLERVKTSKYNIKGYIGNMYGTIKGNLENPEVELTLEKSFINYNNTENAKVDGKLLLKDKILNLENFHFKENTVTGTVDLAKESLNLKANLFETKLNSYYKDSNVRYRVIGVVNIWGNYDNIRAVAQVNLDSIYYRGERIPDLFLKLSYVDGNLNKISESGKLNLTELKILGDNGFNIIEADGYLDIFTKEFQLKLGNENIAVKDIEFLINDYKLSGKLNLNLEAKGNLTGKIDYSMYLKSSGLKYSNVVIDKVSAKITGNEKKLNVEYLEMEYGKNTLKSYGIFDIATNNYDFSVKANDLDLGIFNLFLGEKVKDLGGKANIDISFKNDFSEGLIELKNASVSAPDKSLVLNNLNSKIDINSEGIKIKSFTGSLNNGTISVDGYLKIPKFSDEILANPMSALNDYSIDVKLDNVDYNYDKILLINLDANVNYSNNLLSGDILLNKGNIFKIPSMGKKTDAPPMKIGFNAKLEINTGEGIYFSADNIPLVEDIELKIEGGGTLEIKDDKINFIGRMISEDGALTFNDSIFAIDTGIIIFDGVNEYFPNINPSIAIKAQTEIANEEIYITISGYYDALSLDLQSSSGLNPKDITALLLFKNNSTSSVNSVVKDILDKQFSEEIFSPLSRELEKLFNISKVKISSKILKLNNESLSLTTDLLAGTTIEASDALYKDKVFWNGYLEFSDQDSSKLANYDIWLDYRLNKNLSWQLGVGRKNEVQNLDKLNFHLGIDFKYQRDSIFEKK